MSAKSDLILAHIEGLPVGTKISVRELSALLKVSEGTAYKAVKEAELRGLVAVKPKAGTVRISVEQPLLEQAVGALELVSLMGLSIAAGKEHLSRVIRKIVICDDSEAGLLRQLSGVEPESCLCLCGDRPSLQTLVLEKGANLLLTGGAKVSWTLASLAEKRGLLLFCSSQSTYSLVRLFDAEFFGRGNLSRTGRVGDWMQTPDYLYYNDIVADWQRLYSESTIVKQYPLVDDELELYGGLDLWKAAAAVPSQKLRSVAADRQQLYTVSLDDELREIAQHFIVNGESIATVLDGKRVAGIITANDLLRYYMYSEPGPGENTAESLLIRDNSLSGRDTEMFHIRLSESAAERPGQLEASLLLAAAGLHLRRLGLPGGRADGGTFFLSRPLVRSEGLMLVSRLRRTAGGACAIEAEIYDDSGSYASAVLTASGVREKEEA